MKVQKLTTDVSDEREMNRGLRENQAVWQAKVSELTERLNKKDEVCRYKPLDWFESDVSCPTTHSSPVSLSDSILSDLNK